MATALVRVPPEGKLGPAMQKLPPTHRAFVCALMELGPDPNFKRAALVAGYDHADLSFKAGRLAHDADIQAAILEETIRRIGSHLPMAAATMIDLIQNPDTGAELKFKIASRLLALGGINPVVEQKITVTHQLTEKEKVDRITLLAKDLGLDPKTLLGANTHTEPEDAAFSVVNSSEGLEDVL
jgi:hypothetical protein